MTSLYSDVESLYVLVTHVHVFGGQRLQQVSSFPEVHPAGQLPALRAQTCAASILSPEDLPMDGFLMYSILTGLLKMVDF